MANVEAIQNQQLPLSQSDSECLGLKARCVQLTQSCLDTSKWLTDEEKKNENLATTISQLQTKLACELQTRQNLELNCCGRDFDANKEGIQPNTQLTEENSAAAAVEVDLLKATITRHEERIKHLNEALEDERQAKLKLEELLADRTKEDHELKTSIRPEQKRRMKAELEDQRLLNIRHEHQISVLTRKNSHLAREFENFTKEAELHMQLSAIQRTHIATLSEENSKLRKEASNAQSRELVAIKRQRHLTIELETTKTSLAAFCGKKGSFSNRHSASEAILKAELEAVEASAKNGFAMYQNHIDTLCDENVKVLAEQDLQKAAADAAKKSAELTIDSLQTKLASLEQKINDTENCRPALLDSTTSLKSLAAESRCCKLEADVAVLKKDKRELQKQIQILNQKIYETGASNKKYQTESELIFQRELDLANMLKNAYKKQLQKVELELKENEKSSESCRPPIEKASSFDAPDVAKNNVTTSK